MTPDLVASVAKAKATALSRLIVTTSDGSVDEEATLVAFQELLAQEAEKINLFNQKVKPAVEKLFSENPGMFISSDNVKFAVRRSLDKAGVEASGDEVSAWLETSIKNGYLYSRRGRGGGINTFENALQVTARTMAKGKEVTEEIIAQARQKMSKEAAPAVDES